MALIESLDGHLCGASPHKPASLAPPLDRTGAWSPDALIRPPFRRPTFAIACVQPTRSGIQMLKLTHQTMKALPF